jgi:transcriptional regulator with GAF, ATPase, and Fis domain
MASGLKGELGEARRIQGLLFAARAEPERAKDSFEEALEILADLEDSVELARARFHYGRFLMAEGEREIGRSHLKAAYRAFRKLGTVAEAEEVNRLLFRQEMRADGDMALLQAVSGLSTLGLEPRALIERALSLLREAMGFESGAILLGDRPFFVQGAPDLQSESARSIHPAVQATDRVLSWPVRFGVGLVGRIYLERSRPAPANQNPLVLETLANLVAAPLSRLAEVLVPQVEEAGRLPGLRYRGVIGSSAAINSLLSLVSRVAQQNVPVLIRGESGTGKELVARALHDSGPRAGKPFVAVNCAAVPENLLEAEFFGVDKGAATGVASRKGKFEVADGGTVFLDEIGDMSPALQAKLLRVLQDKTFERVGGVNPISVDVRIVAATNRTVSALIEERKFREDLYYRLNTVELVVPPLRERREDIPRLVRHFVQRSSHEFGRGVTDVSPEAMARLVAQSWPGNIRELEHAVERAVLLAHGDTVNVEDLPQWLQSGPSADAAGLRLARKEAQVKAATEVESAAVLACLEKAAWNVNRAAELAGYSRAQFYRLMKRHNITRPPASSSSD